jgi:hypothetical protein
MPYMNPIEQPLLVIVIFTVIFVVIYYVIRSSPIIYFSSQIIMISYRHSQQIIYPTLLSTHYSHYYESNSQIIIYLYIPITIELDDDADYFNS